MRMVGSTLGDSRIKKETHRILTLYQVREYEEFFWVSVGTRLIQLITLSNFTVYIDFSPLSKKKEKRREKNQRENENENKMKSSSV